jgi:Na+-transporting NADH:ubiquinone oxidoreductase subunit B
LLKRPHPGKSFLQCWQGFWVWKPYFYLSGISRFPDPLYAILSGGVLFGAVFMATDPITAPSTDPGKWLFGFLVGIVAVFIREFSLFPEGMMFAILIMNSFVPLLDIAVKSVKSQCR